MAEFSHADRKPIASHLIMWALVAKFERPDFIWVLFWIIQISHLMNISGNLIIQTPAKEKANTRFQDDLLDATGRSSMAISTSIITKQEARKQAQIPEEYAVLDTFAQHLHFLGNFMLNHK